MLHHWDGIGQVMNGAWFPSDMMLRTEVEYLLNENIHICAHHRTACICSAGLMAVIGGETRHKALFDWTRAEAQHNVTGVRGLSCCWAC